MRSDSNDDRMANNFPNKKARRNGDSNNDGIENIQDVFMNFNPRELAVQMTNKILCDLSLLMKYVDLNMPVLSKEVVVLGSAHYIINNFLGLLLQFQTKSLTNDVPSSTNIRPPVTQPQPNTDNYPNYNGKLLPVAVPKPLVIKLAEKKEKHSQIDWNKAKLEDFDMLEILGNGTYGKVRLCRHKKTRLYFCAKIISKSKVHTQKQVQYIYNERDIMLQLNHPFIVKLYRTFKDELNLYLLMEYVPGGELFNYICSGERLSTDVGRICAAEVLLTIEYLHSKDIAFRDIKPENLLVTETGHLKLCDFGFAKVIRERAYSTCGTPEYLAPEIISGAGHDKVVDFWSFGVLIFDMLAGYPPSNKNIFEVIRSEQPEFPPQFDEEARDLVQRLLTKDPSLRLGSGEEGTKRIKEHPFFKTIDWGLLSNEQVMGPLNPALQHDGDTHNFHKYSDSEFGVQMESPKAPRLNSSVFNEF